MTELPFMDDKTYSDTAQFRAKAYPEFFTRINAGFRFTDISVND